MDYVELEKVYRECSSGSAEPSTMLLPEGVFVNRDGQLTVHDFDAEGNWYEISTDEQIKRIVAARERMGL